MQPGDEYYDAKVKVLGEYIKHHVKEEEQPGGIFAQAKKGDEDLDAMGERLKAARTSSWPSWARGRLLTPVAEALDPILTPELDALTRRVLEDGL
jgi:hypothetical protein